MQHMTGLCCLTVPLHMKNPFLNTPTCRCSKHSHTVILSVSYLSVDVIGTHSKKPEYGFHLTQLTLCYFFKNQSPMETEVQPF